MATAYLSDDLEHNRQVAIKVLKPELAASLGAEPFLKEIDTSANVIPRTRCSNAPLPLMMAMCCG